MNPPLSANSPTAVLSGLAIGGHIHNSIDTIRMLLPCLAFRRPVFVFVVFFFFHLTTLHCRRPFHHHLTPRQDQTTTTTLTSYLQASSNLHPQYWSRIHMHQ